MTNTTSRTSNLRRTSASLLTLMGVLYGVPANALDQAALPQGGTVSSGSATINYSATAPRLDVNQSTSRAVIDWNSFNIGEKATTEFHQPDAAAIAVNRVHDGSPSQILGAMKANGTVMVLNQNGVMFGENAQVDVGGLVASTGTLDEKKFMKDGTVELSNLQTNGKVQNDGTITVADKGLAAFVAPEVVNNGVITAKTGKIALAAGGERATVDLYGDKLVELALDENATKAIATNNGKLEGNTVAMTASAVEGIVNNVVNAGGVIEATGVDTTGGRIMLTGHNVDVVASGQISAKGAGKQDGGKIAVTSNKNVYVAKTAKLDASAGTVGKGGTVDVVAETAAYVAGGIAARGGSEQGDGGAVETSGREYIAITGVVDAGAGNGAAGRWTIDPRDLIIDNTSSDTTGSGNFGDNFRPTPAIFSPASHLDVNLIKLALNNNTAVYVTTVGSLNFPSQPGDIIISANLDVNGGNAASLNLNAAGSIRFQGATSGISSTAGLNLTFIAGSDIYINRTITVRGDVSLAAGGNVFINRTVQTAGGDVTITGGRVALGEVTSVASGVGTLNAAGGDILIKNSDRFSSATADSVRTQGNGTITLNQYANGSLQNAVDAISNNGIGLNRLNVKAGNYTEQLKLTQSNFLLQGDDRNTTKLNAPLSMANSFNEGGLATKGVIAAVNQQNIAIAGLTVSGNNHSDNARVAGIAFQNTNGSVTNSAVKDLNPVFALKHEGAGIYVANTDGKKRSFTVDNTNVTRFELNGIFLTGAGLTASVTDSKIEGIGAQTQQNGIKLVNLAGAVVNSNTIKNVAFGLREQNIADAIIADNVITGRAYGIYLRNNTGSTVTGNATTGGSVAGIALEGSKNALVQGNTATGSGGTGIIVFANSTNSIIDDNTVDGLGLSQTGIWGGAGPTQVTITNNRVSNITGTGIGVAGGAKLIEGNAIINSATAILVSDSAAVIIDNNTIDQASDVGLHLINSADASIFSNTLGATSLDKGMIVENSAGAVIDNNIVGNVDKFGISVSNSNGAKITNNNLAGGSLGGIVIASTNDALVQKNTVNRGATGVFLYGNTANATVDSNTIDGQNVGLTGVYADGSTTGLTVTNNTLSNILGTGVGIDGGAALIDTNGITNVATGIDVKNSAGVVVNNNTLQQTTDTAIKVRSSNGGAVTNNGISNNTGNGIFMADTENGSVSGNTVDVGTNGITVANLTGTATVDANTVTSASYGVSVIGTNNAIVSNNVISGTTLAGFFTAGANNGTVTLLNNNVTSLNDGAHFASGNINLAGTNSFSSANNGLVFDPQMSGNGGAGTLALNGNTFGSTVLTDQAGYYIRLANGALFNPGTPTILDATQVSFDGFVPGSNVLPAAQALNLESRLFDFDDDNTLGQILFLASVDDNTILPDQALSRSSISRIGSVTITGLPYAPGTIPASVLAGLGTAAGGDETAAAGGANGIGLSPEALNSLDSAAGGNDNASCWGDVYNHFGTPKTTAVTFSLDSAPQALFDAQVKCGTGGV